MNETTKRIIVTVGGLFILSIVVYAMFNLMPDDFQGREFCADNGYDGYKDTWSRNYCYKELDNGEVSTREIIFVPDGWTTKPKFKAVD
jgi:hypothetical protein